MDKHVLKRVVAGRDEMRGITPTCSCGWTGKTQYAWQDLCHTLVKEQEQDHVINALRGEVE